jgi:hypothetical protein
MATAGNLGEIMILGAETYEHGVTTSCPSAANRPKPENLLKTKVLQRRFSCAKPENMLKQRRLPKMVGTQILHDKLFGQAGHVVSNPCSCLLLCVV